MADGSWSSSGMPSTRRQELLLERHEVSAVCPMHRRSGGIYSCCADICGLQKEHERVRRLLYSTGDRRFNATVGVAGIYQSQEICYRRFSGIWYWLYGDYTAIVRKKFNTKELVKDVLSKLRYGN